MSLIRLTPELRAERGATMSKRKLQLPAGPVRESDDPFLWLPVLQTEAEGLHSLGRKNLLEVLVYADNDSSREHTTVKVLPAAEKVLEPRLFLVSSSTFGVATPKELEVTKKIYSDFRFLSFKRRTMTLTMFMHYDNKPQSSPQSSVKVKNEVDVAPSNPAMDEPASSSADAGPSDDTASVARDDVQDDKNMSVKGDEKPKPHSVPRRTGESPVPSCRGLGLGT